MPKKVLIWTALALHISCLAAAMVVTKVNLVIDFVGAITATTILFIFPAIGYLKAQHKYGTGFYEADRGTKCVYAFAWLFIVCALLVLCFFFYYKLGSTFSL